MDTKQFLAEFGHIANAPGGVDKLRELILSLAVTGRLVEQNSEDQPASEWLQACDQMKEKLYAEKKIPKPKQMLDIAPEEMPFAPPPGWSFARLGRFTSKIGSGSTPRGGSQTYVKKGIPFLRSQNVWNDGIRLDDVAYITPETNQNMGGTILQAHDLLLNITGASLGRCAVVPTNLVPANVSQHVTIIRLLDATARHYLHICFLSPLLQSMIWSRQVGMAREGLSKKVLEQFEIPLPPIKEQSRIVAKVDELMALCDKLEAKQQARRKLQNALRQSILQAVASATSKHELQTAWTRMTDNFGELFHAPEDVRMLRDVIFDLALRGSLLPEVTDTDLSDLLADGTTPLPRDWHWKTLAELSEYITSGSRGWKSYISNTGDSFIRSQDIKHDALIFENPAFVSLPVKAEGKRTLVRQGDLLLTITGGNVGKCAMVPVLSQDAYVSQHVALIRLRETWLAEFVHAWMINSFGGRNFLARYIYGDKPGLNLTQVGSVPVPVPTQSACVAILTKLRSYQRMCEKFERQLRVKQEVAEALALVTISSLTGIAIEQEEEPMKAPQTELIAPLRLGTTPDIKAQAPLATILARHNGEMSAKDLWQRFGGEIDAFYAQLKTEVVHGWILEPPPAEVREKPADTVSP
ncbi:restriction endonuclease subunit S [Aeromonas sanarellii]|uniref:restriction endonuclease subunit S n=1 Tax=Aeromonas sanarellii TaxID=633415 RepID=UPI0039859328